MQKIESKNEKSPLFDRYLQNYFNVQKSNNTDIGVVLFQRLDKNSAKPLFKKLQDYENPRIFTAIDYCQLNLKYPIIYFPSCKAKYTAYNAMNQVYYGKTTNNYEHAVKSLIWASDIMLVQKPITTKEIQHFKKYYAGYLKKEREFRNLQVIPITF